MVLALLFCALVVTGFVVGPVHSAVFSTYTSPLLREFCAGVLIGAWRPQSSSARPMALSVVLLLVGFAMLVARDSHPLGVFTQIIGATLMVLGALDRRLITWQSSWLRALGDSSYSLYLTHIFALGAFRVLWLRLSPGPLAMADAVVFMPVSALRCVLLGWWCYKYVESPLTRWLNRKLLR
ncbi:MAG: hypothetical protein IPN53_01325 [Comamonadaceae bacterium]|nr:hypothetical protein [Comamonadaceae bacterium]